MPSLSLCVIDLCVSLVGLLSVVLFFTVCYEFVCVLVGLPSVYSLLTDVLQSAIDLCMFIVGLVSVYSLFTN